MYGERPFLCFHPRSVDTSLSMSAAKRVQCNGWVGMMKHLLMLAAIIGLSGYKFINVSAKKSEAWNGDPFNNVDAPTALRVH